MTPRSGTLSFYSKVTEAGFFSIMLHISSVSYDL